MPLHLMVAMPEPRETAGTKPAGLFYDPATPKGRALAEQFKRDYDRTGYGVFETICPFSDDAATPETFAAVLEANGWRT